MTGSCQSCDIYKPWTHWKEHNLGATTRLFCSISWFSSGLSSPVYTFHIFVIFKDARGLFTLPPLLLSCLSKVAWCNVLTILTSLIFPSLEKDLIPPTKYALACFQIVASFYERLWKTSVASYCTANPSLSLKQMFGYGNTIIIIVLIDVMPHQGSVAGQRKLWLPISSLLQRKFPYYICNL